MQGQDGATAGDHSVFFTSIGPRLATPTRQARCRSWTVPVPETTSKWPTLAKSMRWSAETSHRRSIPISEINSLHEELQEREDQKENYLDARGQSSRNKIHVVPAIATELALGTTRIKIDKTTPCGKLASSGHYGPSLARSGHSGKNADNFMRVLSDLCAREWSYAAGAEFVQPTVGRIHFEFSRQNLNRNVTSPSASTVKTRHSGRPRPVWKRLLLASRGHPVRSPACHTSYIDTTHQNQHLHPAIESSGTTIVPTVQLLTKDKRPALCRYKSAKTNIHDECQTKSAKFWAVPRDRAHEDDSTTRHNSPTYDECQTQTAKVLAILHQDDSTTRHSSPTYDECRTKSAKVCWKLGASRGGS